MEITFRDVAHKVRIDKKRNIVWKSPISVSSLFEIIRKLEALVSNLPNKQTCLVSGEPFVGDKFR